MTATPESGFASASPSCPDAAPDLDVDARVAEIYRLLDETLDPCSVATSVPMGLAEMGLVRSVAIEPGGRAVIELRLTSPFCEMLAYMKTDVERKVSQLDWVTEVSVHHDTGLDWDHDMISAPAQARRRRRLQALQQIARSETSGR